MRRTSPVPYIFLAPYFLIFFTFWAWPIIESFRLSFQNTRSPAAGFTLFNWARLPSDPAFWAATKNTFFILGVQVPIMLVLATLLAIALNSQMLKAKGLFRFAFFAPVVVGEVAYSAVFRLLFNGDYGAVNHALRSIGLPAPDWLNQPGTAMAVLILVITWRWTGYNAIIILAGLQSIPKDLYEAAHLDGISPWRQFWRITVPLLRPVLLFTFVLSIIGTLQLFTEPWLVTQGGPGGATETLGTYLYRTGFRSFNFGYASAIAYSVALMAAAFSIFQILVFGREK